MLVFKIIIGAIISGLLLYIFICIAFGVNVFDLNSSYQAIISILAAIIGGLVVLNHSGLRKNKSSMDNFSSIFQRLFVFHDEKALQIFDFYDKKFAPILLNKFLDFYSTNTNIKYPDIEITRYSETLTELGAISIDVFYAIVGNDNTPDWFFNNKMLPESYKRNYLLSTNQFSENISKSKRIMVFDQETFETSLKSMSESQFNEFIEYHSNIELYWCNLNDTRLITNTTREQRDILKSDIGIFDNKLELTFHIKENGVEMITGEMKISNERGGNIENIKSIFENDKILKIFENKYQIEKRYNKIRKS